MRTRLTRFACLVGLLLLSNLAFAQPANDACSNAISIPDVDNFCSALGAGTIVGATDDAATGGYAEASCQAAGVQDVWYSFVATATDATISIIGNTTGGTAGGTLNNPEVVLYEGTCGGTITELSCSSDTAGDDLVEIYQGGLTPGEIYLIRVDGRNNPGTFQFCINNYNPPPDPQSDCPTAVVLCDKSNFAVPIVTGAGNDIFEMDDAPCFGFGFGFETNSTWYVFTAANNGDLTFDITPTNPNDDLDFVVYELPNGVGDCGGKVILRCMASGDFSSAASPCMGATGLATGSTDISEEAGCDAGDDNYLAPLDMVAGTTYAIGINNFTSTGNGFAIDFGGTGEFVGPTADFTISQDSVCTNELITITDNSTFPSGGGSITGWDWNFGVDATPTSATTQGPHNISYTTVGPKIVTLTVMSNEGCLVTEYQTITVDNCCTLDAAVSAFTDPTCGGSDGSITINVNNATAPIDYEWTPNVSTTNMGNNLPAGTYTISVTDANGCSDTVAYTLNTSNGPTFDVTAVVDENCGMGNGSITLTVSGGATPYLYTINGGTPQTSNIFMGLSEGSYTIVVTDDNSCMATTMAMVDDLSGVLLDNIQIQNATCGNANGSITVNASGGNLPYQYSNDNGATFQNSNVFSGLASNGYTVVVMDADGCTDDDVANVLDEAGPTISNGSTDPTCGNSDGTITVTAAGGTTPLQYSINSGTPQATGFFTALGQGVYTILVTDANGCEATDQVTLSDQGGPMISNIGVTPTSCAAADGTITITAAGGTAPLQYSIDNGVTFQAGNQFTGLAAGPYDVIVKDYNDCTDSGIATIMDQPGATISGVTVMDPTCGNINGSLTIMAAGNGPLQYSIDGAAFGTSPTFNNLANGPYTVYVLDANGCTTTSTASLNGAAALTITTTVVQPSCNENNGSIDVLVTGGTSAYQFSVDGGSTYQASPTFQNLAPNVYAVMVLDGNNCTESVSVTLNPSVAPSISSVKSNSTTCNFNNGSLEIFAGGGSPPLEYSINNGISYQAGNIFSGLAPGTYYIIVQDANGCQAETQEDVLPSNPLEIDFIIPTHPTCGQDNGSITVAMGTGTPPYQYSIDGTNFQSSNVFTGLGSGFYTVTVIDNKVCSDTESINLNITTGVVIDNAIPYNGACGELGFIDVNASGGVLNYQYSIDNGTTYQASSVFVDLVSGTYDILVVDAAGCTDMIQATLDNSEIPSIDNVATVDPSTCGAFDGSIDVFASGGSPPFQYSVNNGMSYQSSSNFPSLGANTYNVVIKDAQGCLDSLIVILNDLNAPTVDNVEHENPTCGQMDGSITVTVSGGNPNYEYSIDNGLTFQGSNTFNNLPFGTYTVLVEDFLGCRTSTVPVILLNSGAPEIDNIFVANTSCAEDNGTIEVVVSNGTFPIQYSNDGGVNFQLPATFTNVAPGVYEIVVIDAAGCTATDQVTVASDGDIQIDNAITQDPSTCAADDGSINISASGGLAPFEFSIDNGMTFQSTGFFDDLIAGTYNIVVRDGNDCEKTLIVILEGLDPPVIDDVNTLAPTCGMSNGSLEVIVSGGTPNYQYSIDGGITYQGSNVFVGLNAGIYQVVVVDSKGCQTIESAIINNSGAPSIDNIFVVNPACGNTLGSLEIIVSGGATPYKYSIDNGMNFQPGNFFQNLAAGTYTILVEDQLGCESTTQLTLIDNGALLLNAALLTQPTCALSNGEIIIQASGGTAPVEYSIDNGITFQSSNTFSGLPAGVYNILIKDAGGCTALSTETLNSNGSPTISLVGTSPASCSEQNGAITINATGGTSPYQYSIDGGGTYQGLNIFQNLAGGVYIVVVRDLNGCEVSQTVSLITTDAPEVNILASGGLDLCEGETVLLNAGIGSGYVWSNGQADQVIEVGATGTYSVTVADANGCLGYDTVDVLVNPSAEVDIVEIAELQLGETDSIRVLFNDPDLIYTWEGSDGSSYEGPGFEFDPTESGAYTFTVTADNASGCPSTAMITVIVLDRSIWAIPNAFTPNGDDFNDIFSADINGSLTIEKFVIFNRWGEKVHDDVSIGWDGTFRGKEQKADAYIYTIVIKDLEGRMETLSGEVYLLR